MRLLSFIFGIIIIAGCSTSKNAMQKKINATWIPIQEEIGGKALPTAAFQTQKLVMKDSSYTFTAESVDRGVVKYNGDKIDIYGKEGVNKGKHFTAIYKLDNELLMICYNLKGDSYPEAFETKGKPLFFLCVFKKE